MREREEFGGWKKSGGEREKCDLIESLPKITRSREFNPTIQVICEPNSNPGPLNKIWVCIIGAFYGNLLRSYSFSEVCVTKMSGRHSKSYTESGSGGFS